MKTKYTYGLIHCPCLSVLGVLLYLSTFTHNASAQVYYYYDDNGNRITSSASHHSAQRRNDTNKINVYPNPTNGMVNVNISSFGSCGYATIYIVDGSGNILATQQTSSPMTTINMSSYQQGMYYLRTVTCNDQYTCKIVKVNPGAPPTAIINPHPIVSKY